MSSPNTHSYPKPGSLRSQSWFKVQEPKPQLTIPPDCPLSFSSPTLLDALKKKPSHFSLHLQLSFAFFSVAAYFILVAFIVSITVTANGEGLKISQVCFINHILLTTL